MSQDPLYDWRHIHIQTVQWGEMDALNHVNNVVYFRYLENARIDYLMKLEVLKTLGEEGLGVVLGETRCRYRQPVSFPDNLRIGVRTTELRENRILMNYLLVSENRRIIVAEAEAQIVCVGLAEGRSRPLPQSVRDRINRFENPFC